MRRSFPVFLVLALICFVLAGNASAEIDYTNVSRIPMAVDFSVSVEFDAQGNPQILTDYPFESSNATEMNLVYSKPGVDEAVILTYHYPAGTTSMNVDSRYENLYQEFRDGKLTRNNDITIGSSLYGESCSWYLVYSSDAGQYTSYTEKTHSQGFNAMGAGGTAKTIYYSGNEMYSTRVLRRISDSDLLIERDLTGKIDFASVYQYNPAAYYDYDPSTGLFGGHSLADLGFGTADLEIDPLAMTGGRTGTAASSVAANNTPAAVTREPSSVLIVGGLLSGIMIGLTLYYMFRRRKETKPAPAEGAVHKDETPAQEETFDPPVRQSHGGVSH